MATLIVGAIYSFLQTWVNGITDIMAHVLLPIADGALKINSLSWVKEATQVSVAVAAGLFAVRIGWEALSRYILWNEGTADQDGGQIWKGMLRVVMYGAAGTWLVQTVVKFGIWYGAALMAAPMADAVTNAQNIMPHLLAIPGIVQQDLLVSVFAILVTIICIIIIGIQILVRGAELVFFTVAAPVVALGQFSTDGGIWNSWWRSLVVLSMSQAVQWLGIKGVVASMAIITNAKSPDAQAIWSLIGVATGGIGPAAIGLFLAIGFAIATIRGPHLLREWSYRTGVGGFITSGASYVGQTVTGEYIRRALRR